MKMIPVIHCFDNRYVVPAAVAFWSMLTYASKEYNYRLIVIQHDITRKNQRRLQKLVERFQNATLEFPNMRSNDFAALFENTRKKGHFSKEILYKLVIPDLFPDLDFAIVTDVDCLYRGDIAGQYEKFCRTSGENYLAGVSYSCLPCTWCSQFHASYVDFDCHEREVLRMGVGAGFLLYNMNLMRGHELPGRLIECYKKNVSRIIQPEQDILNLVCSPRIQLLPPNVMVCSYLWDVLTEDEHRAWEMVLANPVQLHFATTIKPWLYPWCTKSSLWWHDCLYAGFVGQALWLCLSHIARKSYNKLLRKLSSHGN